MLRRTRSKSLVKTGFEEDDVNPMESVSNLSDAMLILAVGIMLALIIHWNVNISDGQKVVDIDNTQEVSNIESLDNDEVNKVSQDEGLSEKGKVLYDEKTGKYYMVIDDEQN